MSWQKCNGGSRNTRGSGANTNPPDPEALIRQGQGRIKQMIPADSPRGFTTPGTSNPYQSPRDGRRATAMVTGDLNNALVLSTNIDLLKFPKGMTPGSMAMEAK